MSLNDAGPSGDERDMSRETATARRDSNSGARAFPTASTRREFCRITLADPSSPKCARRQTCMHVPCVLRLARVKSRPTAPKHNSQRFEFRSGGGWGRRCAGLTRRTTTSSRRTRRRCR
eukprot:1026661-Prorocentrum_minimum.AAC.3